MSSTEITHEDASWYSGHKGPHVIKIKDIETDSDATEKFMIDVPSGFEAPNTFFRGVVVPRKKGYSRKSILIVNGLEKYKKIIKFKNLMETLRDDAIQDELYWEDGTPINQKVTDFRVELNEIITDYMSGMTITILLVSHKSKILHFKFFKNTNPHYSLVLHGIKGHFDYPQTILVKTDDRPLFIQQNNELLRQRMSGYKEEVEDKEEENKKVEKEYFVLKSADKSSSGRVYDISKIKNFEPLRIEDIISDINLNDMLLRIRIYPIEYIDDFDIHLRFNIESVHAENISYTTYIYFLYYATFYEMFHRIDYFINAHKFYDEITIEKLSKLKETSKLLLEHLYAIHQKVSTILHDVKNKTEVDKNYLYFYNIALLLLHLIYEESIGVPTLREIILRRNPNREEYLAEKKSDFLC